MIPSIKDAAEKDGSNPLLWMYSVLSRHIDAQPHYLLGTALWAFHTHIYNQYRKSPRLALLSPVHNCGKSTVLDILSAMTWNSKRIIDPSVASARDLANNHTLLLDEVDNMSIIRRMRSILNDGHSVGGCSTKLGKDGEVISIPVYGPVALAAIGNLPATLMSRSIVIRLDRSKKEMERFKPSEQHYLPHFYNWAGQANLNPEPIMPSQIIGREADKWRPLIAIADSFDWGVAAREVALQFINEIDALDIKESVLHDTQRVFDEVNVDTITCDMMYNKLVENKEGEYEIDYADRKITKFKIGLILKDFRIWSRIHRYNKGKPQKCWFKQDFEEMWDRYS
jgi:uncharacterized protein DUF3631